ncbi:MAG: NADH-quinone oxidoreductase subunit M, partial [Acidobacteriaceae bacterium]|nr:NADH-quinone oxidoreductase subunit M [Acidobacteriaceae bacterium]
MILLWLILIPLIGGIFSLLVPAKRAQLSRWISIVAIALDLILTATLWTSNSPSRWLYEFDQDWIPQFGIRFHLALDGF